MRLATLHNSFGISFLLVLAILIALPVCMPCLGQQKSDQLKDQLESIRMDEKRTKILLRGTMQEEEELRKALAGMESEINRLSGELGEITGNVENTQKDIALVNDEYDQINVSYKRKHLILKTRLRNLYKNRRTSVLEILFSGKSLTSALNRLNLMARIAENDQNIFAEVRELRRELEEKRSRLEKKKEFLIKLSDQQKDASSQLTATIEQKQRFLKKVEHRVEVLKARAEKQRKAAIEMEKTISSAISKSENKPRKSEKPLAPVRNDAPSAGEAATVVASSVETGRTGAAQTSQAQDTKAQEPPSSGQTKASRDPRSTNLIWPCGNIDSVVELWGKFNDPLSNTTRINPGIKLKIDKGLDIKASGDGVVVYKGRMEGYGLFVIINHGNELVTVYANLGEAMVRVGKLVTQGEVLGVSGDQLFHFEVRKDSETQNPLNWLL